MLAPKCSSTRVIICSSLVPVAYVPCTIANTHAAAGLQNVPLHGNPVYFSELVTAEIKPHSMQGITAAQCAQAEGQLIRYACGSLLRLSSADAAIQYIKAVKAQGSGCPSIVCRTGELITSSGEVGNGVAFRAPKSFKELPLYFDSLPKLQRPEGQKLQQATDELSAMPGLISAVQDAQVGSRHALFVLLYCCSLAQLLYVLALASTSQTCTCKCALLQQLSNWQRLCFSGVID